MVGDDQKLLTECAQMQLLGWRRSSPCDDRNGSRAYGYHDGQDGSRCDNGHQSFDLSRAKLVGDTRARGTCHEQCEWTDM